MRFVFGPIDGVVRKALPRFTDARGWLVEIFRRDELPPGFDPAMAYVSATLPGVVRGPHEHREQTDLFCFLGSFRIYLWDNRATSPTYLHRETLDLEAATMLMVPPGVVHAYQNRGAAAALVVNCPDRLYQGERRAGPVDEIRHEHDSQSPFQIDERE